MSELELKEKLKLGDRDNTPVPAVVYNPTQIRGGDLQLVFFVSVQRASS